MVIPGHLGKMLKKATKSSSSSSLCEGKSPLTILQKVQSAITGRIVELLEKQGKGPIEAK